MSIQRTVDLHTEEILIEQQIIILPGFFSVERVQVELFFFLLFLCIHTQTHTELCFLCSYLPPDLDPIFFISERIRMEPYLEGRSFRTYSSLRHLCLDWKFKELTSFSSAISYCKSTTIL